MNIPIVNRQMDLIKKMLNEIDPKGEFIEIGCGEGHNLEKFSEIGLKGIGFDFSNDAIDIAKQKQLKNIQVRGGDLFKINENNKDIVFLLFVLEHIKDDCVALVKINSFLKNGGYFILSLPAHSRTYSLQDKLAGHYRRYDKTDIIKKLNDSGFETKVFWSFGFPISNAYTKMYNILLSFIKTDLEVSKKGTKNVEIKSYTEHFPRMLRPILVLMFPLLSVLVRIDFLFLNTDLGTHYIIFTKKIGEPNPALKFNSML